MRAFSCCLTALIILSAGLPARAGTPLSAAVYVSELHSDRLFRVAFRWDGVDQLRVDTPELIATTGNGGGIALVEEAIFVAGAGIVSRVDRISRQVESAQSFNNANGCSVDPMEPRLLCGWRFGLSAVPRQPFGDGHLLPLNGSDLNLTSVAFTPFGAFYATGTEQFNGDFGHIDLASGSTTRLQTGLFAIGAIWDPFSQKILVAGLGRAHLIDPQLATAIASARDDSASQNYLALDPSGYGHALGTLCCGPNAQLVLIDYSETSDLVDATTVIVSVPLIGLTQLSGQAAFDGSDIFRHQFEDDEF